MGLLSHKDLQAVEFRVESEVLSCQGALGLGLERLSIRPTSGKIENEFVLSIRLECVTIQSGAEERPFSLAEMCRAWSQVGLAFCQC